MKQKKSKNISDKYQLNVFKLTVSGILIFAFGIFIGYQLNTEAISKIQGYLFNAISEATDPNATDSNATDSNATDSNATDSNATDSNATDSNATDSNATDSNATDSNATDANASDNNYILFLRSFSLESKSAYLGDKVNVSIGTSGACNSGASIILKNKTTGQTFSAPVNSYVDNPYIIIPNNISAGTYSVTDVLLLGLNSDGTTFTVQYSTTPGVDIFGYDFNSTIEIKAKKTQGNNSEANPNNIKLSSISLKSQTAKLGDKVYIDYKASSSLKSMKLVFTQANNETLTTYASSLDSNPYINIPSNAKAGTYNLTSVTLTSVNNTTIYSNDKTKGSLPFDFNTSIKITEAENPNSVTYNNEDLNEQILSDIHSASGELEVTINADSNPIINSNLFNAIKGKNKKLIINYKDNQIIFNGSDVSNAKTIDVSVSATTVKNSTDISKLISKGTVLEFAPNGSLPSNATMRIKITDDIKSELGNGNVNVYYYNADNNKFNEIATNVQRTSDGYYEFEISHTSKYVLVNDKIDSSLITTESDNAQDNVVDFQKDNTTNLLLIGLGTLLIIVAIAIIIIVKQRKQIIKTANKKTNNDKANE